MAIKLAGREAYTAQHPIATIYGSTLGLDYWQQMDKSCCQQKWAIENVHLVPGTNNIDVLFPQTFSKDIATIFESLVFHLHHHIGQVSLKEPEILHVRRATTTAANRKRLT